MARFVSEIPIATLARSYVHDLSPAPHSHLLRLPRYEDRGARKAPLGARVQGCVCIPMARMSVSLCQCVPSRFLLDARPGSSRSSILLACLLMGTCVTPRSLTHRTPCSVTTAPGLMLMLIRYIAQHCAEATYVTYEWFAERLPHGLPAAYAHVLHT